MVDKLEMFIALAQARHFGRAAEALGVTQPTLSAAIRQLEDSLGVRLVLRGSRFQGLTPEGERVLGWARRIVGDARTMRDELRAAREGLSGEVRLAVIPTALSAVAELSSRFSRAHPNVRFRILSATSADVLGGIEDLSVDAGITYLDNEPLGRVAAVPLFEERYVLLLRADEAGGRESVGWGELADWPLCLLTPDMQNRRIIAGHMAEAGAEVAPRVESNSTIVLVSHVLAGGWATILPQRAAEPFLATGPLAALPLVAPEVTHDVGLVVANREPHPPVLAALLALARRMRRV